MTTSKDRLLFIGVGFRKYDELIINVLRKEYNVYYINSTKYEQKHPFLFKLCNILHQHNYWQNKCSNYIIKELTKLVDCKINKLFVIRGQYLKKNHIEFAKAELGIAKLILYLWDSWSNHSNLNEIAYLFDKVFSFDSNDCYTRNLILRPLFYFEDQNHSKEKDIAVSFVGNDHSQRYKFVRKFKAICIANNLCYKFVLLVGKQEYFIFKYLYRLSKYKKEDTDIIVGDAIPYSSCMDILDRSRVVIDMPESKQVGLTMRTIETLAKNTKLITTNVCIKEYPDVPKEMYLVVNEDTTTEEIVSFITSTSESMSLPDRYKVNYALKEMLEN